MEGLLVSSPFPEGSCIWCECVADLSIAYKFPKALERLEELKKNGGKGPNGGKPAPVNGKLTRKDQKKDEENCVVM